MNGNASCPPANSKASSESTCSWSDDRCNGHAPGRFSSPASGLSGFSSSVMSATSESALSTQSGCSSGRDGKSWEVKEEDEAPSEPRSPSLSAFSASEFILSPLDPGNAHKLKVKIADLGNACWVVRRRAPPPLALPLWCRCEDATHSRPVCLLLSPVQTLHRGHPDQTVQSSGGSDRSRVRPSRRHLEHRVHGTHTHTHTLTSTAAPPGCVRPLLLSCRRLSWRREITCLSLTRVKTTPEMKVPLRLMLPQL